MALKSSHFLLKTLKLGLLRNLKCKGYDIVLKYFKNNVEISLSLKELIFYWLDWRTSFLQFNIFNGYTVQEVYKRNFLDHVFNFSSGTPCCESPITPPTRKHILFLNKNISKIRENYMNGPKFQRKRCRDNGIWTLSFPPAAAWGGGGGGGGWTYGPIFSRRISSEKSPTSTVASFFPFFFVRLLSHSDWSTFLTIETTKTTKAKSGQWKLVQKGPPFHFFTFLNVSYKTGRD